MRKTVKYSSNPFAAEEEAEAESSSEDEAKAAEREHKARMEDGGFIMVEKEVGGKKARGSDGVNTVQAVSQEEAQEYLQRQQAKAETKYTSNKEKRAAVN